MSPFEMVVAIVLISVVGSLIGKALKLKQLSLESRARAPGVDDDALRREVIALRQRVAALETIVTDPGFELSRQIDKLAKAPRMAA